MDPAFHFLFPLMALYAARIHIRHHALAPVIFAFFAMAPDLDHFFGMVPRATLHNVFVVFFLPLALLLIAYKYEKYGVKWKEACLLLLVVLVSHPILDFFGNAGVKFLYPLSDQVITLSSLAYVTTVSGVTFTVLSAESIGVLIYAFILAGAFFLEQLVEIHERTHMGMRNSMRVLGYRMRRWMREP
jgi:membrane-bound metal-dependent hydrolase YbcI (DUF457 family)